MKNPKVGERVKVYWNNGASDILEIANVEGDFVYFHGGMVPTVVDRRQCVRLVKKKRREFWIIASDLREWKVCGSYRDACEEVSLSEEIIHLREVRKK